MRIHGTLASWNDERGFGFIEPATGIEPLFVHISAFPRDGVRPRPGEVVSFEIELHDGKKRAVRVVRPAGRTPRQRARRQEHASGWTDRLGSVAYLLMLVAIGWYGYQHFVADRTPAPAPATQAAEALPGSPAPLFSCDGRTRCPQMKSCAEARFFLKQCPGTQMDGDGDGVPCETQWCPEG